MHTLLALIDAGLGVTLVPQWVVSRNQVHHITFKSLDDETTPYELVLAWHRETTNHALAGLRTVAREVAQQIDFGPV